MKNKRFKIDIQEDLINISDDKIQKKRQDTIISPNTSLGTQADLLISPKSSTRSIDNKKFEFLVSESQNQNSQAKQDTDCWPSYLQPTGLSLNEIQQSKKKIVVNEKGKLPSFQLVSKENYDNNQNQSKESKQQHADKQKQQNNNSSDLSQSKQKIKKTKKKISKITFADTVENKKETNSPIISNEPTQSQKTVEKNEEESQSISKKKLKVQIQEVTRTLSNKSSPRKGKLEKSNENQQNLSSFQIGEKSQPGSQNNSISVQQSKNFLHTKTQNIFQQGDLSPRKTTARSKTTKSPIKAQISRKMLMSKQSTQLFNKEFRSVPQSRQSNLDSTSFNSFKQLVNVAQQLQKKKEEFKDYCESNIENQLFNLCKIFYKQKGRRMLDIESIQFGHHIYKLQKTENLNLEEQEKLYLNVKDILQKFPSVIQDYFWIEKMLQLLNDLIFAWQLFDPQDYQYRNEFRNLDIQRLISENNLEQNFFCMEVLWFSFESTPIYHYIPDIYLQQYAKIMKDHFSQLLKFMVKLNSGVNFQVHKSISEQLGLKFAEVEEINRMEILENYVNQISQAKEGGEPEAGDKVLERQNTKTFRKAASKLGKYQEEIIKSAKVFLKEDEEDIKKQSNEQKILYIMKWEKVKSVSKAEKIKLAQSINCHIFYRSNNFCCKKPWNVNNKKLILLLKEFELIYRAFEYNLFQALERLFLSQTEHIFSIQMLSEQNLLDKSDGGKSDRTSGFESSIFNVSPRKKKDLSIISPSPRKQQKSSIFSSSPKKKKDK